MITLTKKDKRMFTRYGNTGNITLYLICTTEINMMKNI